MLQIAVVGTGNVGWHLCRVLEQLSGFDNGQVYNTASLRSRKSLTKHPSAALPSGDSPEYHAHDEKLTKVDDSLAINLIGYLNRSNTDHSEINAPLLDSAAELGHADLIFLCVPDDAIAEYNQHLPKNDTLVVHCSGTVSMDTLLPQKRRGVFYMLQSFIAPVDGSTLDAEEQVSPKREDNAQLPNFSEIPILVEAAQTKDLTLLKRLAYQISEQVQELDSAKRKHLHCAAVFANNFSNHCYALAEEIASGQDIDRELLLPLIQSTLAKAKTNSFRDIQSGPARRGDMQTVREHLELLDDNKRKVYKSLTESIKSMYGN